MAETLNPQESKQKSTEPIKELDEKIELKVKELERKRQSKVFLFMGDDINPQIVSDVFQNLRKNYRDTTGKLDVLVDSGGGDIHAAYNLASLFKKYAGTELTFIIPRWAKSAATLMACGGDKILMTQIAELGPLDPQITQMNPMEQRLEEFSPLHIESTLDLIRQEMNNGNEKLGELLAKRLQFPITIGGFIKSIEIGGEYLNKLLSSRMFKDDKVNGNIEKIAERLTKGYCDHGFCINFDEAKEIGLKVEEINNEELDIVWEIYSLHEQKEKLKRKVNKEEMLDTIKNLPIPEEIRKLLENGQNKNKQGDKNDKEK